MSNGHQHPISDDMSRCIQLCQDCHSLCTDMITYTLEMGGAYAQPSFARLLLDCAEICQTSANFMLRGSPLHDRTCGLCADICERCAQACDQWPDNAQMKACAALCRQCAESCRDMAAAAAKSRVRYDDIVADTFPASDPPGSLAAA